MIPLYIVQNKAKWFYGNESTGGRWRLTGKKHRGAFWDAVSHAAVICGLYTWLHECYAATDRSSNLKEGIRKAGDQPGGFNSPFLLM